MVELIIFIVLALVILVGSLISITAPKILHAATSLLFVLFATAGLYFLLGYTFLGAVQIGVYAGGILILYVFAVLLTSNQKHYEKFHINGKMIAAAVSALAGLVMALFFVWKQNFITSIQTSTLEELPMHEIGEAMMGAGKFQYILPFEAISILLLACIVGGIVIARKSKTTKKED